MKCPSEAIQRTIQAAIPNPPMSVDSWLENTEGVVLPERGNAFPGPISLNRTPYLKKPLQLFTDYGVERIGFCAARQVAKTTYLTIILGYIIDYDPGPTLLFYPTQALGKSFSKDRLQPVILNTPRLAQHIGPRPDDWQLAAYTLDRMTVRFGHAGSELGGRSHPIRYLLKDETSAMTSSSSANADDTTSAFWNRRILEVSTPSSGTDNMWRFLGLRGIEGKTGEQLWDTDAWEPVFTTTVLFYYVPCPHCSKMIQFLWRQVKWPKDCAIREIPKLGYYICQECEGEIRDYHKAEMLSRGEWLPHEKQRDQVLGKWVGFHLNKMYGPWDSCTFGAVAHAGLRARLSRDPEVIGRFVNNFLALPYSYQQEQIELVGETAFTANQLTYHRNTIPDKCRVLTVGIDVGKETASRIHYVVQGFGPGSLSWRIAWGKVNDLLELEAYIREVSFQHPVAGKMVILCGAMDSRYNKSEVLAFCRRFRNRIFPIQGERQVKADPTKLGTEPHKAFYPERDEKGKPLPTSMIGYRINTVYWKQFLYSRMNRAHGQEPSFFFPVERDSEFERHLASEHEVLTRKRGTSELQRAWVVKPGYEANHYLDATIYGLAIASVFGLNVHAEDGKVYTGIKAETPKAEGRQAMQFPRMQF